MINSNEKKSKLFLRKVTSYIETPPFAVLIFIFILFSIFEEKFISLKAIASYFSIASEFGIIAIGLTLLMIGGDIDLSLGSVYGLGVVIFGQLLNLGVPLIIAMLITMSVGLFTGFINGLLVVKLGLQSFIATISMMLWWRGVLMFLSGGAEGFKYKGESKYLELLNIKFWQEFHLNIIWFIVLVVIFQVILYRTKFGNYVFAAGGAPLTARALGVNVARTKMTNFLICGVLTTFSSCLYFSRVSWFNMRIGGGVELQIIAITVIGGLVLRRGKGSVFGTFLGALTLAMIYTGLVLVGVSSHFYMASVGALVIITSFINNRFGRLKAI